MAAAPVGDDQFGEDPTINELQSRIAALLGKEAALWLPSGTMANQVALRALTRPGDDVIVSRESHAVWHETGGGGANAGIQFTEIGAGGRFTAGDFIAAMKPRDHMLYPPTALVEVELLTGRTHQIRAHFADAGFPLLGDALYGGRKRETRLRPDAPSRRAAAAIGRQALHAAVLGFTHPTTGVPVRCDAPLPADFRAALRELDIRSPYPG